MDKKTIKDIGFKDRAVIVRMEYNVPLKKKQEKWVIADSTRILQSLPTLEYILGQNPKRLVIISHLGRPKKDGDPDFSMGPIAKFLEKKLEKKVELIPHYLEKGDQKQVLSHTSGEVLILENIRYHQEEELNNRKFSAQLARLGDVFVNDAFGACHRAHASVVGIAEFLPAVAGFLLEKEIHMIGDTLKNPKSPFVVILGGAKATTKIPMIERLMTQADFLLLGGGVANTFLRAFGYKVGCSVYSRESLRIAQNLIWKATRANTKLFLPSDVVVGNFSSGKKQGVVAVDQIPLQLQALDIGPQTTKDFCEVIAQAKTIIWNGPVGANEIKVFAKGTEAVYQAIVANKEAVDIVGGGDTLSSIQGHNHLQNISHISTGGGAMLEYIEKGSLPGIDALQDK